MGLRDSRVDRQGCIGRRVAVVDGLVEVVPQARLGDGEQRPRLGVIRVDLDRPPANPHHALLAAPVADIPRRPELARHQVEVVRLDIVRAPPLDRLLFPGEQGQLQRADDGLRDLVLDGEDVIEVAVEPFGPQVIARRSVDELRGDPHALPGLSDAALQHVADIQLAGDFTDGYRPPLERERRVAGDHAERRNLGEVGGDVLADAVAEVFLFRIAAHVLERQDADR